MKTTFKHAVKSFRGTNRKEELYYSSYKNGEVVIAKTLPEPTIKAHHHIFGTITKHLHKMYKTLSAEYKLDLSCYAKLFSTLPENNDKLPASGSALFTGMLWKLKKLHPEIDLATITREEIVQNEYPMRSVVESMQNGLLVEIEEASMLDHVM